VNTREGERQDSRKPQFVFRQPKGSQLGANRSCGGEVTRTKKLLVCFCCGPVSSHRLRNTNSFSPVMPLSALFSTGSTRPVLHGTAQPYHRDVVDDVGFAASSFGGIQLTRW